MMNETQIKMVENNHNLIYKVIKDCKMEIDEYYDLAAIGLCKAALNYDETKGIFSTYAYTIIKQQLTNYLQGLSRQKRSLCFAVSDRIEAGNGEEISVFDMMQNEENFEDLVLRNEYVYSIIYNVNDREKEICKMLMEDKNQTQIGKELGISRQRVDQIIRNMREKLIRKGYTYEV